MKNSIYFIITFTLIFFGCEKIDTGKAFDCKIGNFYKVNRDLTFTIDSINDSRCPENVVCVWAGKVDLYFNILHANNRIDTVLTLDPDGRKPFQVGDYTFRVLEVNPISGGTTTSKDITIKMIIMKI